MKGWIAVQCSAEFARPCVFLYPNFVSPYIHRIVLVHLRHRATLFPLSGAYEGEGLVAPVAHTTRVVGHGRRHVPLRVSPWEAWALIGGLTLIRKGTLSRPKPSSTIGVESELQMSWIQRMPRRVYARELGQTHELCRPHRYARQIS